MTRAPTIPAAAVLTGDIVASSDLPQEARAELSDLLRRAANNVRETYPNEVPFSIDVFRGDSWQLIVVPPARALRIALLFRAVLRHESEPSRLDTRTGIGMGQVDFVFPDSISQSDGEAFRLSGGVLERLGRRGRRLALAVPEHRQSLEIHALNVILSLVDVLAKKWTAKQALAVTGALRDMTQEEIGSLWHPTPVTQQAVAQHLDGAGWSAIADAVQFFENAISKLDDTAGSTKGRQGSKDAPSPHAAAGPGPDAASEPDAAARPDDAPDPLRN